MPNNVSTKTELAEADVSGKSVEELTKIIDEQVAQNDELIGNYLVVNQITVPSEEWIEERLGEISYITKAEAVTKDHDPNGLLGKEGGYVACIYFAVGGIDARSIPGDNIIDKGTDAGGAIEIYDSGEYALNRCDYLSQFDGTILYSGSYTAVGTMVIRTSYKLNDKQQVVLTDSIISKLTQLK